MSGLLSNVTQVHMRRYLSFHMRYQNLMSYFSTSFDHAGAQKGLLMISSHLFNMTKTSNCLQTVLMIKSTISGMTHEQDEPYISLQLGPMFHGVELSILNACLPVSFWSQNTAQVSKQQILGNEAWGLRKLVQRPWGSVHYLRSQVCDFFKGPQDHANFM